MTKEQALQLFNYLDSARRSARELISEIDANGPVDFEQIDSRGVAIVNDIEFDVGQAAGLIEGL
jgi:hypothetical protein